MGQVIDGRYELLNKLADGGFSEVFRARQLNTGKVVAIKLLLPDRLEKNEAHIEVARFEREMKLVAELKHPNIVPLLDSGRLKDGQLFQVLEYIEGLDLDKMLRLEGPFSPTEAKHLMMQVLDALSAAHDAGIVHRDLKPRNIMVSSSGLRRNALVLDFGLGAVVEEARDADYLELTARGKVPGTPAYVAPEQLLQEEITPQSDIYAWGLVFAECIIGGPVVKGANLMQICRVHLAPEPLELPDWIAETEMGQVIARSLEKSLDDRYATALDVFHDLERCEASGIIVPAATSEPLSKLIDDALPSSSADLPDAETLGSDPDGASPSDDGVSADEAAETTEMSSGELPTALSDGPDEGDTPLKEVSNTGAWVVGVGVLCVVGVVLWMTLGGGGESSSTPPASSSATGAVTDTPPTAQDGAVGGALADAVSSAGSDVEEMSAADVAPQDTAAAMAAVEDVEDEEAQDASIALTPEALEAMDLDALDALCVENRYAACVIHARKLLDGERNWANGKRAADELNRACQADWGEACLRYADLMEEGLGVLKAPEKAAQLRADTCDKGHGRACYELGDALLSSGKREDVDPGVALIKKSCDAGDLEGCERYGTALLLGKGVEGLDVEGAFALYERACEGEYAPACRRLGTFYKKGEVVPRDASRTVFFYEKACGLGEVWSCNELAYIHNSGMEPLGKSPELAQRFYGRACELDSGRGCYQLAQLLKAVEPVDEARVEVLLERACRFGEKKACDR